MVFAQPPEATALLQKKRLPGWGVLCLLDEDAGEQPP